LKEAYSAFPFLSTDWIKSTLQEYCYDDYTELAQYIGEKLVNKEGQTLNQDILKDGNKLLETLADEFKVESTAP